MAFGLVGGTALTGFAAFGGSVVFAGVGAGVAVVAGTGETGALVPVVDLAVGAGGSGSSVFFTGTSISSASADLALVARVLFGVAVFCWMAFGLDGVAALTGFAGFSGSLE